MKIYNSVTINITGRIIEEDSYEYFGEVALCGGPGAAGGGGTSNVMTSDADVKAAWTEMVDDTGAQTLSAGNTLIEVMDAALSDGGNPYDGEVAYNPSMELSEADTQLNAYETITDALDAETDADSAHTKALELVSDIGFYDYADLPDAIQTVIARALANAIADATALLNSADVASDKVSDYRTEGASDQATAISDAETNVDGLQATAITTAGTIDTNAKAKIDVEQKYTEALGFVNALRAQLSGVENTFNVSNMSVAVTQVTGTDLDLVLDAVVAFVLDAGKSIVDGAVDAALTKIASTVNTISTAFSTRQDRRTARAINRFSGGMADFNAVMSSAYVIGVALVHSDAEDQATEFEASLYNGMFRDAMSLYINAMNAQFSVAVETAMNQIRNYINKLLADKGTYAQLLTSTIPNYVQAYLSALSKNLDLFKSSIDDYSGLVTNVADSYQKNKMSTYDIMNRIQSGYNEIYSRTVESDKARFVDSYTTAIRTNDALRSTHALQSLNTIMTAQQVDVDAAYKLAHLSGEVARMKTIAYSEQFAQNLQIDVGGARWPLETFQYAANVFGGFSGGTVATPVAYTKAQTALSGALAGASIGASTGNPAGVLVGALVGGIGGALMR